MVAIEQVINVSSLTVVVSLSSRCTFGSWLCPVGGLHLFTHQRNSIIVKRDIAKYYDRIGFNDSQDLMVDNLF